MTPRRNTLDRRPAGRSAWARAAGLLRALRERGRQRRELVRLLAQLDAGLATGARV